jgi:hypothetical protein
VIVMAESADAFIARKKNKLLARPVVSKDIGQAGKLIWCRRRVKTGPPAPVEMWAI